MELSEQLSSQVFAETLPVRYERPHMFLAVIVVMGVLMGAAAHTSLPVFLAAAAAITLWLLGFGVREGFARTRRQHGGN